MVEDITFYTFSPLRVEAMPTHCFTCDKGFIWLFFLTEVRRGLPTSGVMRQECRQRVDKITQRLIYAID